MKDALVACRDCGGKISRRAKSCPHCGADVKTAMGAVRSVFNGIVYVMFAVILFAVFVGFYMAQTASQGM
jgi:predicted nucleic acid-binding Zn ribbon protein